MLLRINPEFKFSLRITMMCWLKLISHVRVTKALVMIAINMDMVRTDIMSMVCFVVPFIKVRDVVVVVIINPERMTILRSTMICFWVTMASKMFETIIFINKLSIVTEFCNSEVPLWISKFSFWWINPEIMFFSCISMEGWN